MMERISEPELMEDPRQVAAYAGPHLENGYWLFIQRFRRFFPPAVTRERGSTRSGLRSGCYPASLGQALAAVGDPWRGRFVSHAGFWPKDRTTGRSR